ncbi:MAG: hypothetical protein HY400_03620 [Elusimicrobia bacterium]|nr:hypothetical protein [Elusimicrobiota bacterium]
MRKIRFAVGVLVASLLVFLFVWQHVQATRLGYEVQDVRKNIQWQKSKNAYTRLQLQRLVSPARIAQEASRRLGMSAPGPTQIVLLGTPPSRSEEGSLLLSWLK